MEPSKQQADALRAVREWHARGADSPQVFRLFGPAGTGKTSLACRFAESVRGPVIYGAFTGKAAHVLRQRGCEGASTLHALIYTPKDKSRQHLQELEQQVVEVQQRKPLDERLVERLQKLVLEERANLARPMFQLNSESPVKDAALLVSDEVSMVDQRLGQDMESFGCKILVLGDQAQLPPVFGGGYWTEQPADFLLDEVHRQARGSPVLHLATEIREQRLPPLGPYGESRVITRAQLRPEEALAATQILCGRNATRRAVIDRVRELRGHRDPLPMPGERLVCLRNNHELGLLNGSIWHVLGRETPSQLEDHRMLLELEPADGGPSLAVEAHTHHFLGEGEDLPHWERRDAEEFDFGYCLTVHKAQGSQWADVLLIDESRAFRDARWRWLYTGVTRACDRVTIVQEG